MNREGRIRLLFGTVTVAFALVVGACGGDDSADESAAAPAEDQQGSPTQSAASENGGGEGSENGGGEGSKDGKGDDIKRGSGVETPEALVTCLEDSGYEPIFVSPPAEGTPGAEFGSLGTVRVDLGSDKVVAAIVFETPGRAKEVKRSIFGQDPARSKAIGPVYLATNRAGKTPREFEAFLTCLRG